MFSTLDNSTNRLCDLVGSEAKKNIFAGIRHLEQYVGVYAMQSEALRALIATVNTPALLQAHIQAAAHAESAGRPGEFAVTDGGVAIVDLAGGMTKHGSSLSEMEFGTIGVRRAIRNAAASPQVRSILLRVESGGGTIEGTQELARDVARAAESKPVAAFIDDIGASAAYWVASQATRIFANEMAKVGSIGTFAVIHDFSEAFAQEGVKVHVVSAGDFKGFAERGTEVTEEQLDEVQRVVTSINGIFLKSVADGRSMSAEAVAELADGRIHIGAEAVALGLVDEIASLEDVIARMEADPARAVSSSVEHASVTRIDVGGGSTWEVHSSVEKFAAQETSQEHRGAAADNTEEVDMSTEAKAAAASYPELKEELVGADSDFLCAQLDAGATLAQARKAWMAEMQTRNVALQDGAKASIAERVEAEKAQHEAELAAEAAAKSHTGVRAVKETSGSGGDDSDALSTFHAEVLRVQGERRCSRSQAHAHVCRSNPELREQMVAEHNARHAPKSRARAS